MTIPHSILISTGARLHFGPLTNGRQRGRLFGGIGMMLEEPELRVSLQAAKTTTWDISPAMQAKVEKILASYRAAVPENSDQSFSLAISADSSLHAGLGTGTQLSLAVVTALDRLVGRNHTPQELAKIVGRGQRSALGIHGFEQGGFLVDGGKRDPAEPGTLIARCDVPEEWRVLLITPPDATGLSGPDEERAFLELDPMSEELTARLCRLVLLEILPALQELDFETFSSALHEYGAHVGDYFSAVQGARYAHPAMCELAEWLQTRGLTGVGQTSWGPTLFGFCENQIRADDFQTQITGESKWSGCRVQIATPKNHGATILTPPAAM